MIRRLLPARPPLRALVPARPDRLRIAFVALLLAVFAVTAVRYAVKASKPSELGTYTRTAFLRWRPQVRALDAGTDIYRVFAYPNPPVMALVLRPFYELPPLTGALTWFAFKAALAGVTAVWVFRLLEMRNAECGMRNSEPPGTPDETGPVRSTGELSSIPHSAFRIPHFPDWAKAVAVLLGLHPVLGDLAHGNVNLFVAFLVIAALELYRRRRDGAAGVVLALAVACKVTPALFLPYFVWKRAWRLLAGAAAGLALWLVVVPAGALGWGHNRDLLGSWFDVMVRPFVLDGKVTSEHPNQSVPGLVFRLLTREPSFVDYDEEDRPHAAGFHNVADVGAANARLIVKGCMAAFGLAVVLTCRWPAHRPGVPRAGPRLAAEFALIALGMLLFSERTWKHHAVTLILPYAVLTAALAAAPGPGRRAFYAGVLAVAAVLTVGPSVVGGEWQDLAMVYGSHTAAFAVLAVGVGVVAADRRLKPAGGEVSTPD